MSNDRLALGRQIYDYFVGKGLAPHQAAAIAGNMAWEGGGRIDLVNPGDNIKNSPRSPHSVGVGQWNDRLPALVDYARKSGINLPDGDLRDAGYVRDVARQLPLNTQLDFAWNEMQGPERRAYEGITSGQDLRSATAGAIGYHRPAGWTRSNPYAGHGFDNRVAIADQILRASQAGGASVSAPSGMSGSAFHAAAFPAPYALGGPKQAAEPVSTSSAVIPAQAKAPATEQPRAPAWDAAGFWDKQMLEGHADGGPVGGDDVLSDYREPVLKSHNEPWYRAFPNKVTDWLYGPDANVKQAAGVRHLLGPENPLNLPGQFSEGVDTAKVGYATGNNAMTGLGALQAVTALPLPGPKGMGSVAKAGQANGMVRAFHGSNNKTMRFHPYSEHEIGPHFGTVDQANSRLSFRDNGTGEVMNGAHIIPVDIDARNMLEIRDPGAFDPLNLPHALEATGKLRPHQIDNLKAYESQMLDAEDRGLSTRDILSDFHDDLSRALRDNGYDGLRYRNTAEHPEINEVMKKLRGPPPTQGTPEYDAWSAAWKEKAAIEEKLAREGPYSYVPLPTTVKSALTGDTLYADGGAVDDDLLADYRAATQYDPLADYRTKFRNGPPVSGYQPRSFGTLSAMPDRPSDWAVSSGLAETLSPIAQGYGAGQMAGDAYSALNAGDYASGAGLGALAAMSMLPMKKGAPVAAAEKPAGIRAYHGSPHDFDKFDMSKIGTGEGAQAYGHGMYFAENEATAKSYRDTLKDARGLTVDGADYNSLSPVAKQYAAMAAQGKNLDVEAARLASLRDDAKAILDKEAKYGVVPDAAKRDFDGASRLLADLETVRGRKVTGNPGRMYEVNIKADPEHFLDWDKPLSQQSEKVRQAIEKVAPPKSRDEIQAAHDAYKQANADWMARPENVDTTTAAALENAVGDAYKNWRVAQGLSGSGSRIYTDLARGKPYSEGANALRDAGIPGIKYLDQGSRGAGDGSRNYVVFDPATIEILRKYGILGPMAAGVGAGAMQDSPEGFAEGGPVTLDEYRSAMPDDPLNAYRTQLKTGPDMVAPWDVPGTKSPVTGTLSNPAPRPGEYLAPAYEAVSPMVGGYGLAQGLGDVYNYAKEGDWKGVAESGIPLAAMAVMPGPKAKKLGALETPFYHGTTHEINPTTGFKDPRRGGPYTAESHHGAAPYLTSSESDARGNYAGVGPDLTGRIAQHAERLENDIDGMDRSDQARALLDYRRAQREGLLPDYAQKFGYSQRDAAKAWGNAFSQLVGPKVEGEVHQLVPIPQNPVRLDAFEGKPATHFDFGRAYVDQDAKKGDYVVYDQNGKKIARYPDEADAYDHADNMQPDGPAAKMIEHIRSVSPELADEVYMKMIDYDGMSAKNFEDTVRKSDHVYDLYDDNGEMMGPGQIIQDAYRAAGYDAVIMPNADQQFKNMGLARGTTHIAMFDHTKVRKPEAKFDPKKKDSGNWLAGIAATLGIGGGSAAMNGDMGGSDYRRDYANGGRVGRALAIASKLVDRNPTDAQKESGNYAKGHAKVHGLDVTIENPKGSERSGMGRDGKRWSVKMPAIYGYVKGTEGFDGDHVDVYIGPDHDSKKVFVVDQINAEDGKFDEHKCLLSYPTKEAALADYRKAFSDGKADQRIGAVTEMTIDRFKSWVKSAGTQVPLGDIRKKYANGGAVIADEDLLSDYR